MRLGIEKSWKDGKPEIFTKDFKMDLWRGIQDEAE